VRSDKPIEELTEIEVAVRATDVGAPELGPTEEH
jgi:hypothetical protein